MLFKCVDFMHLTILKLIIKIIYIYIERNSNGNNKQFILNSNKISYCDFYIKSFQLN